MIRGIHYFITEIKTKIEWNKSGFYYLQSKVTLKKGISIEWEIVILAF